MLCPGCHKTISEDSRFCPFCGNSLSPKMGSTVSQTIKIGRAADNDLVLSNPTVSSHHCQVQFFADGSILLKDLGSSNGVFVNGIRITEAKVSLQDNITLGMHTAVDLSQLQPSPKAPDYSGADASLGNKTVISIGRDPSNDITINNIRVSRQHARLEKIANLWQLTDLGSTNGTFVNGKKISKANISASDSISVGGVPLALERITRQNLPDWSAALHYSAKNLSFCIGAKTIVDNISLSLQPGQFTGLIGPSGCGKTTLMMMLNGYLTPSAGEVNINGLSLHNSAQAFQGQIGYVPQDDIIHRELTVQESLKFTSMLRLGNDISASERDSQIAGIMKTLNLTAAKDTLIGSPEKKGISGGQRKRVNMAQELITEPLFYFLDEPTSGLDPRSDKEVMQLLKEIANRGHLVLLTTHKIDALNFSIFTHLIVLGYHGKLAYYGPAQQATPYFGVQNPEDIFDLLENTDSSVLQQRFLNSPWHKTEAGNIRPLSSLKNETVAPQSKALHQLYVLCLRALQIKYRDRFSAAVLLLQAPIIGLFINLVFRDTDSLHGLYFVLIIAAIWLGCSNSARELVSEQTVFKREYKAGLSLNAYLWSKISVLALLCLLQTLILSLFTVFTTSLNISFGALFAVLSLVSIAAMNMGLALSAMVKTGETAMALVPVALIPQVILGGLIVPFGNIPDGVNIIAGFMLSRWAFELLIILEDNPLVTSMLGFSMDNSIIDIGLVAFIMIFFMVLTRYILAKKMRNNL